MNIVLFDGKYRKHLLPFTFTRPVAEIRIGILTIAEKWAKYNGGQKPSYDTEPYLSQKFPRIIQSQNVFINASYCPNQSLWEEICSLKDQEGLYIGDELVAYHIAEDVALTTNLADFEPAIKRVSTVTDALVVRYTYDIFSKNAVAIAADFELLTKGRQSAPISSTNSCIKPEHIFIEPGAKVEYSILNASEGPIYIGQDAEIMEGCKVRGPFAMCEHAGLKMDAKIGE